MSVKNKYSAAHRFEYWMARLLFVPIRLLPIPVGLLLARGIGRLCFHLLGQHRRLALDNVRAALGAEIAPHVQYELARGSFENFAMNVVELVRFASIRTMRDLESHVEFEGWQAAQKEYDKGNGVIYITGHIGNWEMAPMLICRKGLPFCVVARAMPNGFLDDYLTGLRETCGQQIVKKRGALKPMLAQLKSGAALGFLIDQNARKHGVMVKFFGRDASTIPSVAALAMKLKVPVVAGACYRIANRFRFRLVALPPLEMVDTGDHRADLIANTQEMTRAIEQLIRHAPEQWLWAHNRWRIKESWFSKGRLSAQRG